MSARQILPDSRFQSCANPRLARADDSLRMESAVPKTNITLDSTTVGQISFEIQNIYARSGPDFPQLCITLDLSLSAYRNFNETGQPVRPLSCVLLSGEFCAPPERKITEFRDEIALYAPDVDRARTTQLQLQIHLDIIKVGRIEQMRDGDLRAALVFRPLLAIHGQGGAVERFEMGRVEAIAFAIPKSEWAERLLPQLGYGGLELLEVRVAGSVRPEGLPQSVQELREAQKYLNEGEWEKAVGHCRNAVEAIPESRNLQLPAGRTSFAVKVDTCVNEHLGAKLGEMQAKLVADELKLLWEVSSKAVHPTAPDYFKRADAEFIVRNTMAIVEYVGKLLG